MSAPTTHEVILPPIEPGRLDDPKELYKHLYEIWKRTGGYTSQIVDLKGLKASVAQLNTLVGIRTDDTVQEQIDSKVNRNELGTMAFQDAGSVDITGGDLAGVEISESVITTSKVSVNLGATGTAISVGGTAHVDTTQADSVGAAETDLMTYVLPANSLNENNSGIELEGWGQTAANATPKVIKLYFGSTLILNTGAVAANNASWRITASIVRNAAGVQKAIATIMSDSVVIAHVAKSTAPTEDEEAPITIRFTGQGTANGDVDQRGLITKWFRP